MQPPLERISASTRAIQMGPGWKDLHSEGLLESSLGDVGLRYLIETTDASTLPRHCGGFHTQWTAIAST